MGAAWHPSPWRKEFQQSSPSSSWYEGTWPSPPWGRETSHPPPRPVGRWSLLSNHFPSWERFPGPPPPGHYNPRFPPDFPCPSHLICYFFLFWEEALPFLGLFPLHMSCPVFFPLLCAQSPPPSPYDSLFPSVLGISNWLLVPGPSESDTKSVASQSPSKLAYDTNYKSKVPCLVALLPNLGGRPH